MDNKTKKEPEFEGTSNIEIQSRKQIHITGVTEVISATTTSVELKTACGKLTIGGTDLKIKNLNNEQKELYLTGILNELKYNEKKKNLFEKVFK